MFFEMSEKILLLHRYTHAQQIYTVVHMTFTSTFKYTAAKKSNQTELSLPVWCWRYAILGKIRTHTFQRTKKMKTKRWSRAEKTRRIQCADGKSDLAPLRPMLYNHTLELTFWVTLFCHFVFVFVFFSVFACVCVHILFFILFYFFAFLSVVGNHSNHSLSVIGEKAKTNLQRQHQNKQQKNPSKSKRDEKVKLLNKLKQIMGQKHQQQPKQISKH